VTYFWVASLSFSVLTRSIQKATHHLSFIFFFLRYIYTVPIIKTVWTSSSSSSTWLVFGSRLLRTDPDPLSRGTVRRDSWSGSSTDGRYPTTQHDNRPISYQVNCMAIVNWAIDIFACQRYKSLQEMHNYSSCFQMKKSEIGEYSAYRNFTSIIIYNTWLLFSIQNNTLLLLIEVIVRLFNFRFSHDPIKI
jgi:hypothetical protein